MNLATLGPRQLEACDSYPKSVAIPPFDPHGIDRHQADAHWVILDSEAVTARCSLWWRNTPSFGGDHPADISRQVGLIGHFAAANNEAAAALLDHACSELASQGCSHAVGPLDGNTWRNYRLVTDSDQQLAFFLEPQNRFASPDQFRSRGFSELAFYFSAVTNALRLKSERVQRIRCELTERNVRLRPLSDSHFEADLRQIHYVAHQAFQDNLMYQNIGADQFIEQYQPLRNKVPFDFILLAEQQGRAVGFVFAVPDFLQAQRGLPINTIVVKTLGVLPGREFAGLGQLLLEEVQQRAADLGFSRAIHAMVRESGHLQKISRRYAVPFRRYALFAKELSE